MSSNQEERGRFIESMRQEGMSEADARAILRDAQTIQRCAELTCSSEAADCDRVPCPNPKEDESCHGSCLCRDFGTMPNRVAEEAPQEHGRVPRHEVQAWRAQNRIEACVARYTVPCTDCHPPVTAHGSFKAIFSGDPRGACVKIIVPSGRSDSWGGEGMCVPTR